MHIHLVLDQKFTDNFIETVEKYGNIDKNRFLCRNTKPFKYVISNQVEECPLYSRELKKIINNLLPKDTLVIHCLDTKVVLWLLSVNLNCKIAWIIWGGEDFYYDARVNVNLYDSLTLEYVKKRPSITKYKIPKNAFKRIKQSLLKLFKSCLSNYKEKALNKVHYLYHYNPHELDLISKYYNTNMEFVYFFYTMLFINLQKMSANGVFPHEINTNKKNILIGNSAHPTNNHLDIFKKINKSDNYVIWTPLAYDDKEYASYIAKVGREYFGGNFNPILEYHAYANYFAFLEQIDICIMGHRRSQAMGNLMILLYLGKPILLNSDTTTYKFLISEGFKVFPIPNEKIDLRIEMTEKDILNNKKIIKKLFFEERISEVYQHLFS